MFRDRIRHLGLSLALALALLPGLALAQLELSWARPSSGHIGTMLALDGANNVYSVGSTGALATVIKHGPDGTLLWERTLAGASAARGVWVDTDPQGNAVVLINQVSAANNSPIGVIVAKFSPAGDELWRDDLPLSLAYGVRVATDGVGNAYVLGVLPPQGGTSFNALYKYSPAGTRLWAAAQTFRSPLSMVVTPGGRVLITGGAVQAQMAIEAYDAASGARLFSKLLPSVSGGQDIAVGPAGEFYAVGQVGPGVTGTVPGFLVVKHDAAFNELWRRSYAQGDTALRVALDGNGNPFVAGRVGLYSDWLTLKLDAAGSVLWERRLNTHLYNDELPQAMLVQPDGSVAITGQTGPGPTTGTLSNTQAGTSVHASADGAPRGWANYLPGARGMAVKRGTDGALYVLAAGEQTVLRYAQGSVGFISIDNWPVAVASAIGAVSGNAPLTVNFSSAGSMDPDGTGIFTRWSFGDGSSSTEVNPSHTYTTAGSYAAVLTVTDFVGHAVQATPVTVTVTNTPPPPPQPTALLLQAATVKGGESTKGTVVLGNTAGATVALRSSNAAVRVPSKVVIPAGTDRATFIITSSRVRRTIAVTLTARANGGRTSAVITVTP